MTEVLIAAEMRAVEGAAISSGAATGLELMESAGDGVIAAMLAEWPDLQERGTPRDGTLRAVVLCGPGNNGGDGFVIARLLRARGWQVEVFLLGESDRLPPDARANFDRWSEMGEVGQVSDLHARLCSAEGQGDADGHDQILFVDALFGTGLTRPVEGNLAEILRQARDSERYRTVAVDMPSGHCADSGRALGAGSVLQSARPCDLTVSFHRPKAGQVTLDGARACGALAVADIGLDDWQWRFNGGADNKVPRPVMRWFGRAGATDPDQPDFATTLGKSIFANKFDHGHALVLSGPPGHGGAARLAARGALRAGAGLVSVGCPLRALPEHAAHLDAIMLKGLDGTAGLAEVLEDTRINAVCLGPGLGLGPATAELVRTALKAGRALVLDADALSRFQRDPQVLFAMLHRDCVLTPHGGEFWRLFPDLADRLTAPAEHGPAFSKLDATREAAARAGCTVLFKGPDTVVADPDGHVMVVPALYDRAAPWLATAGAGDVLAGIICGLLARGFPATRAACNGALLHVEAARAFGPGLIAEDLPETLPRVFRDLGL